MAKVGKVLVVDDSEVVLSRVQTRLTKEGYEVVISAHPVGVGRHEIAQCDLVLLDYHMPGISGGEALHTLRQAGSSAGAYPAYFLYTSDKTVSLKHRELGFDGALINKGDDESLVQQLGVALRLTKLNILRLSARPKGR
jgi:CheY-like chemotaxis protein